MSNDFWTFPEKVVLKSGLQWVHIAKIGLKIANMVPNKFLVNLRWFNLILNGSFEKNNCHPKGRMIWYFSSSHEWLDLQFSSRPLDSNSSLLLVIFWDREHQKERHQKWGHLWRRWWWWGWVQTKRRSNFRADLMLLHEKNELRKNAAAAALQNSDLWKWSFSGGQSKSTEWF